MRRRRQLACPHCTQHSCPALGVRRNLVHPPCAGYLQRSLPHQASHGAWRPGTVRTAVRHWRVGGTRQGRVAGFLALEWPRGALSLRMVQHARTRGLEYNQSGTAAGEQEPQHRSRGVRLKARARRRRRLLEGMQGRSRLAAAPAATGSQCAPVSKHAQHSQRVSSCSHHRRLLHWQHLSATAPPLADQEQLGHRVRERWLLQPQDAA